MGHRRGKKKSTFRLYSACIAGTCFSWGAFMSCRKPPRDDTILMRSTVLMDELSGHGSLWDPTNMFAFKSFGFKGKENKTAHFYLP